jgi:rRNA processing protein Gar1
MQNLNEHRVLISFSNQHSNSDSANSYNDQIRQMECVIPNVAVPENKERQDLPSGCRVDNISNSQNCGVNPTAGLENQTFQDEEQGYTYSYMIDKMKRNPEEMIDQITFSDDEEDNTHMPARKEKMTSEVRENELKNICDLYEEDASMTKYTGTKNEIDTRKEIPIPFQLTKNDILLDSGIIDDIIDDKVIIKANTMNGTLDLDNILFTINKIAIGFLDDVLGKIDEPVYIIKLFPNMDVTSLNLLPGQSVYNVKDKSKYVERNQLYKKGCDASNAFDEEVSDDEMEFSDDEEEMTRRSQIRKRKKSTNSNKNDMYKKRKIEEESYGPGDKNSLASSMNKLKEKYAFKSHSIQSTVGNNLNTFNPMMYDNKYIYQTGMTANPSNQFYSYEYKIPNSNNVPSNMNNQMNPTTFPMNNFGFPGNNFNVNNTNSYNPYSPMNPMSLYSQGPFNNNTTNTIFNQPSQNTTGLNLNFQSVNPFQPPSSQNNFK